LTSARQRRSAHDRDRLDDEIIRWVQEPHGLAIDLDDGSQAGGMGLRLRRCGLASRPTLSVWSGRGT
jgi:hypothetical protein